MNGYCWTACGSLVYSAVADGPSCRGVDPSLPDTRDRIIIVGMSQIEIVSHKPFVWMVFHFYHSHMQPVRPSRSRTGHLGSGNLSASQLSASRATTVRRPRVSYDHMGFFCHVVHHLYSLLSFCFVSVPSAFHQTATRCDFSQAPRIVSGLRSKSANGLSLSRLPRGNRIHMGAEMEDVWFTRRCWWGVASEQRKRNVKMGLLKSRSGSWEDGRCLFPICY